VNQSTRTVAIKEFFNTIGEKQSLQPSRQMSVMRANSVEKLRQ
jgi:hypothetical protein